MGRLGASGVAHTHNCWHGRVRVPVDLPSVCARRARAYVHVPCARAQYVRFCMCAHVHVRARARQHSAEHNTSSAVPETKRCQFLLIFFSKFHFGARVAFKNSIQVKKSIQFFGGCSPEGFPQSLKLSQNPFRKIQENFAKQEPNFMRFSCLLWGNQPSFNDAWVFFHARGCF